MQFELAFPKGVDDFCSINLSLGIVTRLHMAF
ncbi:Uncharacterised protein [Vibrio cholerae]|nr:Uncharacterised protein [Vibrio cholerae]